VNKGARSSIIRQDHDEVLAMAFVVRLHRPAEPEPRLLGRVFTAADALALVRQWRDDFPDAWVEIVPPHRRPSAA
jgi:hypothetical protein